MSHVQQTRSLGKRLWYAHVQLACRLVAVGLFHFRCRGREHVPREGGLLLLANHQSYLDPLIVGLACDRSIMPIARKTLFRFAPFRWLIESLDTIPIDRGRPTIGQIKEVLARLKRGDAVLVFVEGTRTLDGEIGALEPGFCALARRAAVPIVVTAIDGAYDAWPRRQLLPRRACIRMLICEPMSPAAIAELDDRALVASVERQLRESVDALRADRRRAEMF